MAWSRCAAGHHLHAFSRRSRKSAVVLGFQDRAGEFWPLEPAIQAQATRHAKTKLVLPLISSDHCQRGLVVFLNWSGKARPGVAHPGWASNRSRNIRFASKSRIQPVSLANFLQALGAPNILPLAKSPLAARIETFLETAPQQARGLWVPRTALLEAT